MDPVGKLSQVERIECQCWEIWSSATPDHPMPKLPNPSIRFRAPGAGPNSRTSRFDLNAGNAAPTQIPSFTKQGHVTYQNAAFWMLMAVLPAVRSNSEPDVTILLRGVIEGR